MATSHEYVLAILLHAVFASEQVQNHKKMDTHTHTKYASAFNVSQRQWSVLQSLILDMYSYRAQHHLAGKLLD